MLYAGSGGETKSQLESALHLDDFAEDSEFYDSIKFLIQNLLGNAEKDYTFKRASRLYGQEGLEFNDDYIRIIEEYFGSNLVTTDFSGDPSGSRSKINKWVEQMTSGKIKELIPGRYHHKRYPHRSC